MRFLLGAALLLGAWTAGAAADPSDADLMSLGRRLYTQGLRADGSPLIGVRWDEAKVSGPQAACVLCHKRSGLGAVEGNIQVPPISGPALFGGGRQVRVVMDPRGGKAFNRKHEPYTDASLATSLRTGQRIDGQRMHTMMPRYELNDEELRGLTAYLRQLSAQWSPGVSRESIRLATVIAGEVTPEREKALTNLVSSMVSRKNALTPSAGQTTRRRHMTQAAEFVFGTQRKIEHEIWRLTGPATTWQAQLEARYREKPVFALASGLSETTWAPVEAFCEQNQVPCWFPNLRQAPAGQPRYAFHFMRGTGLEADVLAQHLIAAERPPKRLLQVYQDNAAGRAAAAAMSTALMGKGIAVKDQVVRTAAELAPTLAKLGTEDAVMLWLPSETLAALPAAQTPAAIYASGLMGRGEWAPVPAAWHGRLHMVYPYELPERRLANLSFFRAWMKQWQYPMTDEFLLSEAYFAMNFLFEVTTDMLDNLHRDYLLERAENMISLRERVKVEEELRVVQSRRRAPTPEELANPDASPYLPVANAGLDRQSTTVYPRLALGPDQRYASKGAYIVRFGKDGKLVAESDWIVP